MLSLAATLRTVTRSASLSSPRQIRTTAAASSSSSSSIHTTAARRAYKDDQDRESLNPKAPYGEHGQGEASHNPDAYSPGKTDPAKEKRDNPEDLEVSGANQSLSKPQGDGAPQESRPSSSPSGGNKPRSGGRAGKGKAGKPNL